MQRRRAKIPGPGHVIDLTTILLNEGEMRPDLVLPLLVSPRLPLFKHALNPRLSSCPASKNDYLSLIDGDVGGKIPGEGGLHSSVTYVLSGEFLFSLIK
ncbi:hypothetical protein ACH5RR_013033 [Cinchona calisaya]|uniref:Uncharacterized protein n=1 Tax=Cinchona calisaya TaxID=153742 RepID=A0ABD2ZYY1_9GENT